MGKDQSKDKERAAEEAFIKTLPLIKEKYLVQKFLGGGFFGKVYKVQEKVKKKLGKEYALKVIPLSFRKKISKEQEREIERKTMNERHALTLLAGHDNVVRLESSWMEEMSMFFKGEKAQCFLLEYCKGSDLDHVLKGCETGKCFLPRYVGLYWFIIILRGMSSIHENKILHRDVKPDNILCTFDDLQKALSPEGFRDVGLKISDFGSSMNIESKKAMDVAGQIYFTAPEVWAMDLKDGYDSRCDVWSLGIMFAQILRRMSLDSFQKKVQEIFDRIEKDPILNEKFKEKYKVKKGTPVLYLKFMSESGLFMSLAKKMIPDEGIHQILNHMLVPYEKRKFVKDILDLPHFRIWEFAMFRSSKLSDVKKEDYCIEALVTLCNSELNDEHVFDRIIDMIEIFSSLKVMEMSKLLEGNCFPSLFYSFDLPWKKSLKKSRNANFMKIVKLFVQCVVRCEDKREASKYIRNVVIMWRKYPRLSDLLQKFILEKKTKNDSKYIYFFTYLLMCHWKPLAKTFDHDVFHHFKTRITKENSKMMFFMLETLATLLPIEALLEAFPRIGGSQEEEKEEEEKKKTKNKKIIKKLFNISGSSTLTQQFSDMAKFIPDVSDEEEDDEPDRVENNEPVKIVEEEIEGEGESSKIKKVEKEEEEVFDVTSESDEDEGEEEVLFKVEEGGEEEEEEVAENMLPEDIQKVGVFFLRFCPVLYKHEKLFENAISNIINHFKEKDENIERILYLLLFLVDPLEYPRPKNDISLLFSALSNLTKCSFNGNEQIEEARQLIKISPILKLEDGTTKKKKKRVIRDEIEAELDKLVGFKVAIDQSDENQVYNITTKDETKVMEFYTTTEMAKVDTNPLLLTGEDLFCVAFFEIEIGFGGDNDGIKIGWTNGQTKYMMNTLDGMVEVEVASLAEDGGKKDIKKKTKKKKDGETDRPCFMEYDWELKKEKLDILGEKTKFGRLYAYDQSFIGTGVTNKGHVFWTYNNQIFKMLDFPMNKKERKNFFHGTMKIEGNRGLLLKTNFGQSRFEFTFKNLEEQRQSSEGVMKQLNNKKRQKQLEEIQKVINLLSKYDEDLQYIKNACKLNPKIGKYILKKLEVIKDKVSIDQEEAAEILFRTLGGLEVWEETEKNLFLK